MKIRIGTRGSDLALTQARATARSLEANGATCELVIMKTAGDVDRTSAFAAIGPPGVFVREIETALLESRIDLAVHSYKDLPSVSPDGLVVAAVPERADPREVLLIAPEAYEADGVEVPLRADARVGTSAARRVALLKSVRPDLVSVPIRGNVPTRVGKLFTDEYDAVVLAAAGLARLRGAAERGEVLPLPAGERVEFALDPLRFVPAPSQGALALQVRADDAPIRDAVAALDHPATRRAVAAERALLTLVQAGCDAPFGAHGTLGDDDAVTLHAVFETEQGDLRRVKAVGHNPAEIARAAHDTLMREVVR
jgi:hydroxymethylbilane synthase